MMVKQDGGEFGGNHGERGAGVLDHGIGDGNDNAYLIPHKRRLEISQITLI